MDLFSNQSCAAPSSTEHHTAFHEHADLLFPITGVCLIKGLANGPVLLEHIHRITQQAPFRHMMTPMGHPTQVAMSNCGQYGWTSSEAGYGYKPLDPQSNQPWPAKPNGFLALVNRATQLAKLPPFQPDSALINRYDIGMAMGRHRDKDEADLSQPIVSVSLGLSAVFQIFTDGRNGGKYELLLQDGDVLIMYGPARGYYHGIKPIKADALQPNLQHRYNLTMRRGF